MIPADILIVEDEGITAKDIKNSLEKVGYSVMAVVTTGEDAIKSAEEKKPDLVIMDIKLEGTLDGIDAAKVIESKFGIPILYLTSYSDENTIKRVKSSNPSAFIIKDPFEFLHKPFEENELYTAIEIALQNKYNEFKINHAKNHYQLLKSVLNSVSDGVIATDLDGRIILMNPSAERFTGTSEELFLGANLEKLIPNIDITDITEKFKSTGFYEEEFSIVYNKNDLIKIKCNLNPINNEFGILDGVVIIFNQQDTLI